MRRPHQEGLTLVELLVAITIFGLIITAVLSMLPSLFKLNRATSDAQATSAYAKSVMESTRIHWLTKVTPTAPSTDAYPNFTAGTLPSGLPTVPSTLTCDAPAVTAEGSATPVGRRRLTIKCTAKSTQQSSSFVAEFGRPQ